MRLAVDQQREQALELVMQMAPQLGDELVTGLILQGDQSTRRASSSSASASRR
jgi:hypothetical protein